MRQWLTTTTLGLRRPSGAAHRPHGRREARPERALDARRPLGPLRPRPAHGPAAPDDPDRDRFLLSKGHGPAAYYAVLAAKGFVDVEGLAGFGTFESPLGHHPDRMLVPGVEISSGSLGHGLPIAVGMTLAPRGARPRACARVLPGGRRRARRGQQLGGGAARRPAGARSPHRRRGRQPLLHLPLAGRHRARASSSRAGARLASTGATTRARAGAGGDRRAPPCGRRGGGAMTTMRKRFYELATRALRRRSARGDRARRDRRLRAAAVTARCSTSASASSS